MYPNTAPGMDGMHASFFSYKKYWSTIGLEEYEARLNFLNGDANIKEQSNYFVDP